MQGAPSLNAFRSTILQFLKLARAQYIEKLYVQRKEEADSSSPRITKKSIREKEVPYVTLEVVPLVSDESLVDAINRFSVLKTVSVRLLIPNNELSASKFFSDARKEGVAVNAGQTTLTFVGKAEGLAKDKAKATLKGALDGNAEVAINGTAAGGEKLKLTNEELQITGKLIPDGNTAGSNAKRLLGVFTSYVKKGLISLAPSEESARTTVLLRGVNALVREKDEN